MKKYKGIIILLVVQLVLANLTALLFGNEFITATIVTVFTALMYIILFGNAVRKS